MDNNTFSHEEALTFFAQILAKVQASTDADKPIALAIVGNYRDLDTDVQCNFQHVQGNTPAILSAVSSLVRGTFEHYADNNKVVENFRAQLRISIPTPTDPTTSRPNYEPQIHEILSSASAALNSDTAACRVVASGINNEDGTIWVQQVCEGNVGPLAMTIVDIVTEFVRENKNEATILALFQRELNRAFE